MRLNLFFKDATIKEIHPYEFEIKFDISSMRKPVLSENSRMYIENVNLCEFRDTPMGEELGGFLQLRCDDIDSEYNYSSDPNNDNVIYQSSLKSFHNFQNNDPMKNYNFKIRKSFLSSSLIFNLQVFDLTGKPFVNYPSIKRTYVTGTALTSYETEIQKGYVLFNTMKILEKTIKTHMDNLDILKYVYNVSTKSYNLAKKDFLKALDNEIIVNVNNLRNVIKTQYIIDIIESDTINDIFFLFDKIRNNRNTPWNKTITQANDYILSFYEFTLYEMKIDEKSYIINNLTDKTDDIYDTKLPVILGTNNPLFASDNYTISYTSKIGSKSGTIDISVLDLGTNNYIAVNDISPTSTTDNLNIGDIMVIDGSNLQFNYRDDWIYSFNLSDPPPSGITYSGPVLNFIKADGSSRVINKEICFYITKNKTEYLDVDLTSSFKSSGFNIDDIILIKGKNLKGTDDVNDLFIRIKEIDTQADTEVFTEYIGHDSNIALQITRLNEFDKDYSIAYNIDNTSGYNVTDVFRINGSELNGTDLLNDFTFYVSEIIPDKFEYVIEYADLGLTFNFKSKIYEISPTNSTTSDAGISYKFDIHILNGNYVITLSDPGINFVDNETVTIKGDVLDGKSTDNDIIITISSVDGADNNKILSFSNTDNPRDPFGLESLQLTIIRKNEDTFDIKYENNLLDFKDQDSLTILGTALGLIDATNNVIITFKIENLSSVETLTQTHTGVNVPIGEHGKIKSFTTSGKGFFHQIEGHVIDLEIIDSDIQIIDSTDTVVTGGASNFDILIYNQNNVYLPKLNNRGSGAVVGDIIVIDGSKLGGVTSTNDCTITVLSVENTDEIGTISSIGDAVDKMKPFTYASTDLPNIEIEVTNKYETGLTASELLYKTSLASAETLRNALVTTPAASVKLDDMYSKLKGMNVSLVLYDEIDEIKQASSGAINGNTYSRLNACQFKRI